MKKHIYIAALIIFAVTIYSCATIMHGTKQDIGISSEPTGAKVLVDGQFAGETPLTKELKRKDNHIVRIVLEGYKPFETTLSTSTSGWVWGNIVFGGLIGLAVDAVTGGLYDLSPEQVNAQLREEKSQALYKKDSNKLFITVTLKPKPEWKKIGQLIRR